jgi:hypothetical protein
MTTTPQFPDAARSILASDLPDNSTAKAMAAILLVAVIAAALIYYLSPMRLARVLVAVIVATEKTYLEALETGLLSVSDVHTAEMLSKWVDPWFPSSMDLFDMPIDSSSKPPPFAKGPSATPCLLVQPSASSLPAALSPSSAAFARCTSSRHILRYIYSPFDTIRSGR